MIAEISDSQFEAAVDLLGRFFREENFAGDRALIRTNLDALRRDENHWAAGSITDGEMVGIVTVTTMLYVEWGRLGEIGDLYVLPYHRGRGVGRALVEVALDWCQARGCSAVTVTITAEGEARHKLAQFYSKFGFRPTDRISSVLRLN